MKPLNAMNKTVELLESEKQPRAILFETALHGELWNLEEEDNKRHYAHGMSADPESTQDLG